MTAVAVIAGLMFGYAASWLLGPLLGALADVIEDLF